MLKDVTFNFTTDALGDATVNPVDWYGPARLLSIMYDYGNAATGADLTFSYDLYNVVETVLTITNAGVADAVWYPRRVVQGNTGANLTGAAGGDTEPYIILGRPKLVVAQGGNAKTGAIIWVLDPL
mgnify:FL=1